MSSNEVEKDGNGVYNYEKAVREDLADFLREFVQWEGVESGEELREMREKLEESAWVADSVTGNGSGSYWFSTWKAEEAICHNLELLGEACEEFGDNAGHVLQKGAESADVTIRCYLLGMVLDEVIEEVAGELDGAESDK